MFLLFAAPLASSVDAAPLDYFLHAAGPAAQPTLMLDWVLAAVCMAVCLIIAALLAIAIFRRRGPAPSGDGCSLATEQDGMAWIRVGVTISTVVLIALLVFALVTLQRVAQPRTEPALTITVTAYNWWWKISYEGAADPSDRFTTANEIHIPVGEPVRIRLESAGVIHTFWVPALAGKTQAIPGQTNQQWIQADAPGIYRGQCSQFCGAQHAHMAFEVVAQSRADFASWSASQAALHEPANQNASAAAGHKLFDERCAGCHAVRGTSAAGALAPDLTHLNSRRLIAAGTLSNSPTHQLDWIEHAQRIKPDAWMPSMTLTRAEAENLAAFLATLQ